MSVYQLSKEEIWFPIPQLANQNGLLAVGGDLSIQRLLLAYRNGIFPWYNPGEEIMWWCPKERFVIYPSEIKISNSMKKFMRKTNMKIQFNTNFSQVIHACRVLREEEEGTWITDEMEKAYNNLFHYGNAMSVECYIEQELVGGLYGVLIGKCFFGESMFSKVANASKMALITLAQKLEKEHFVWIDCQFHTDHLEQMGGRTISFEQYQKEMNIGLKMQ